MTFEQLIARHRSHVGQVIQEIARRHHLSASEAEEFAVSVERALERNDHELLRAFDGRASWETYLTTVVTRLFLGFQSDLWGHWRPSALAQRLGPTATLLEELMQRDRMTFDDALDVMRTTHRVDAPRTRLEAWARELGLTGEGPVGQMTNALPQVDPGLHSLLIKHALKDAIALLSPEDRLILQMRYVDGAPTVRIAKLIKMDPRPLQRRIEQVKDVVRTSLLTQGIAPEDIEAVLGQPDMDPSRGQRKWWQAVLPRPSN